MNFPSKIIILFVSWMQCIRDSVDNLTQSSPSSHGALKCSWFTFTNNKCQVTNNALVLQLRKEPKVLPLTII